MTDKPHPTGLEINAYMQLCTFVLGHVRHAVVAEVPAKSQCEHDARVLTVLGSLFVAELASRRATVHNAIAILIDLWPQRAAEAPEPGGPATPSTNSKGGAA